MELDAAQNAAITMVTDMNKRVVSVTGQAGTGKTTIIKAAADRFKELGIPFVLAAPTGKAARRIREVTGYPAVTIHRLLEYPRPGEFDENGKPIDITFPKRNRNARLSQKVIIVDEYAMVPYELHNNLIAALPDGGCLRAFGDMNQLPPIEKYTIRSDTRSPFQKLLETLPSITLTTIYRQGEDSDILAAASSIRKGIMPRMMKDFRYQITGHPRRHLEEAIMQGEEEGRSFGDIEYQVITPTHKGFVGTEALNNELKALINPAPEFNTELPRELWYKGPPLLVGIGDKVVCNENCYDLRSWEDRYAEWDGAKPIQSSFIPCPENLQMMNGEIGKIISIEIDNSLQIDFGDRIVRVPSTIYEYWPKKDTIIEVDLRKKINLAYALTTHKCQGSEFKEVIYIISSSMGFMLGRQNFYTAVTRAREKVLVLTDQRAIQRSVRMEVRK